MTNQEKEYLSYRNYQNWVPVSYWSPYSIYRDDKYEICWMVYEDGFGAARPVYSVEDMKKTAEEWDATCW